MIEWLEGFIDKNESLKMIEMKFEFLTVLETKKKLETAQNIKVFLLK